jgi:hypothetical protein
MNRAGGLPVDARSADRITYIRACKILPEIGTWKAYNWGCRLRKRYAVKVMSMWLSTFFMILRKGPEPRARLSLVAAR